MLAHFKRAIEARSYEDVKPYSGEDTGLDHARGASWCPAVC